jgi:hypothetical protein
VELSLNTYSECVDSFIAADRLMGTAFRQKLAAYQRALELAGPEPEWGFKTKFARDCRVDPSYIHRIHRVVSDPELLIAISNFSSVGLNTLTTLAAADPETKTAALEQLDRDGELTVKNIRDINKPETVDGDFTEIDSPEPDLSNIKIDPASISIGNTEIEQLATFVGLCGSTASLYNNQSGEQLTAETFSGFVVNNFVQQLDSLDPSHRADHYSFLLNNLTELVGLLQQTIELIPSRIPLKSIS